MERFLEFVAVIGLVFLPFYGTMIYRLAAPVPKADIKAIELYLTNRDERLVRIRKVWLGGPVQGNARSAKQSGHPYEIVATDDAGNLYTHRLAAVSRDALGNVGLMKNDGGGWDSVLQ